MILCTLRQPVCLRNIAFVSIKVANTFYNINLNADVDIVMIVSTFKQRIIIVQKKSTFKHKKCKNGLIGNISNRYVM